MSLIGKHAHAETKDEFQNWFRFLVRFRKHVIMEFPEGKSVQSHTKMLSEVFVVSSIPAGFCSHNITNDGLAVENEML